MSEKIIRIKSGNEEITMNVTEEEYRNYFRPWWQMKKREQRNREAMEQNGYTEESYEEWKENDMRTELFAESMEELAEKRMLLGVLQDAMDSLLPEEREFAIRTRLSSMICGLHPARTCSARSPRATRRHSAATII